MRIIKGISAGKDRIVYSIADVYRGQVETWTFFTLGGKSRFNRLRQGRLVWGR